MADKERDQKEKDQDVTVKVVDRRWWANAGTFGDAASSESGASLKPTYVEQLEQQLAEKDRQAQEFIAKYRQASAGFEEARLRLRREIAKDVERARRDVIVEMLEVLDNLDRAIASAQAAGTQDSALLQGVELVRRQFLSKLENLGVQRIESAGQAFDPAIHEAVTTVPAASADQNGVVVGVIRPGTGSRIRCCVQLPLPSALTGSASLAKSQFPRSFGSGIRDLGFGELRIPLPCRYSNTSAATAAEPLKPSSPQTGPRAAPRVPDRTSGSSSRPPEWLDRRARRSVRLPGHFPPAGAAVPAEPAARAGLACRTEHRRDKFIARRSGADRFPHTSRHMYSREEVKAITDKVMNMAKADTVEVEFNGGERSATRFANSNITANMVQFDRNVSVTIHLGARSGSASSREFDDASLQKMVDDARANAEKARENPEVTPLVEGPQDYITVDATLPSGVNFGPAERAKMVRQSLDVCQKKNVIGSGFIPKNHQTTCSANSKGLFAYYQYAEASFILTCRTPDGGGSGWSGLTGIKDVSRIDATQLTEIAADKALKSQKPRAIEPGRYTVILEPRANARFLSLMTGLFNARTVEGPVGNYFSGKEPGTSKIGEKVFSDAFTLKSDIGNDVLRQTPILGDGTPARPVTWIEKGVLKNLAYDRAWAQRQKKETTPANVNMSLVMEGSNMSVEEMIKSTKRGLLVTFFWYIRGVDQRSLLNTGMTRDGLFLIENGEITGPVQNFRWNMSPIVGYNNITAVGQPVPIHTGESYDGPGTALVPPVRIEDFFMTSVSPAV